MPWTNKCNLPAPLCTAIERIDARYHAGNADISVTSLIDSPLISEMKRRHHGKIAEDYADAIWKILGTLAHGIMEAAADQFSDRAELVLIGALCGWRIKGQCDMALTEDGSMIDYKLSSVWTAKAGGREEWTRQENLYLWLMRHCIEAYRIDGNGKDHPVDVATVHRMAEQVIELDICLILRDWGPRNAQDIPAPVCMLPQTMWTDSDTEAYLRERIAVHQAARLSDCPPACSDEERWAKPSQIALMKKGRKSAMKLFDAGERERAEALAADTPNGYIEERPGEYTRCEKYCEVGASGLCPYWKPPSAGCSS